MTDFFGHHELHNRYRFEGTLRAVTALRVSSGKASDMTDAPFMRTLDQVPYIPGSTLRGALRSELERIVAATPETTGLCTCSLFSSDDCAAKARDYQQKELALEAEEGRRDERLTQFARESLCDVCRLFGTTVYASRLVIEDATPIGEWRSAVRDGVGIDRDTGAAREGVKFNYEVIEPGAVFSFSMTAENIGDNDRDRRLINLALAVLRQGLFVGGKRAAGLGRVQLGDKLEVKGFENPASLWEALLNGQDIHKTVAWSAGGGGDAKEKAL